MATLDLDAFVLRRAGTGGTHRRPLDDAGHRERCLMAPRRPTPAQIRERRSKIAVVVPRRRLRRRRVIQGPKVLKMLERRL